MTAANATAENLFKLATRATAATASASSAKTEPKFASRRIARGARQARLHDCVDQAPERKK